MPGETLNAAGLALEAGGKGFNLATAARRLGADVTGVFGVGQDLFADYAAQSFQRADLPLSMLTRHETATACGIGFTDLAGENCIAVYPGANAWLSARDVEPRRPAIRGADMLMAQFEAPDAPILAAFIMARASGRATLLNPSPCRDLDARLLAATTILVMNEGEAIQLGGAHAGRDSWNLGTSSAGATGDPVPDHEALASRLMVMGPDLVVITLGARGAVAFARGQPPIHRQAFRVEVHDTIGCGDAFTAGLAMALVEGRPLAECLLRGAACGAIVAGQFGVFDALPTTAELERFLRRSDLEPAVPMLDPPAD